MAKTIIDISSLNGSIKSTADLKAHADGVMVRIGFTGYGSGEPALDPKFERFYQMLHDADVKMGFYYFTLATTEAMAEKEAKWVVEQLQSRSITPDYPVAIDVESQTSGVYGKAWMKISKAQRSKCVARFCSVIQASGYYATIYANPTWFSKYLDKNTIASFDKWVAQYRSKCTYSGTYGMWQYTSSAKGSTYGIGSTNVDVSHCYIDYPTVIRKMSGTAINLSGTNPYKEPTRTLKKTIPCMKGDDVKWLQYELYLAGYLAYTDIDGSFGNKTLTAVKSFQLAHLTECGCVGKPDGKVGAMTRAALRKY